MKPVLTTASDHDHSSMPLDRLRYLFGSPVLFDVDQLMEQIAYRCTYLDHQGNKRVACFYALDAYNAKLSFEELVGEQSAQLVSILPSTNFDW